MDGPRATASQLSPLVEGVKVQESPMGRHRANRRLDWVVRLCGVWAASIGAIWLALWLTGVAARWAAAGALIPKANMALGMTLGAASLLLLADRSTSGARRWTGAALAAMVFLIGGLTLSEHVFGYDLGIDQVLATEQPGAAGTVAPNRVGPPGSLSLALLGAALLAVGVGRRRWAPYLALAVCLVNMAPLVGYLYGITEFYNKNLTGIAWPTVTAMLALALGLIASVRETGPTFLLMQDDSGGLMLRRLLPAAVLIPLILGWLSLQGEYRGWYDTPAGTAWLILGVIVLFAALLWRNADSLNRAAFARQVAADALAMSESRLRALLESASQGVAAVDESGRMVLVNARTEEMFGYTREELLGQPLEHLIPERYQAAHGEHMRNYFAHPHTREMGLGLDLYGRTKNGAEFPLEVSLSCIEQHGSRLALALMSDITTRKQAEEQVSRSQKTFSELVERAPFGIYVVDSQFRIAHDERRLARRSVPQRAARDRARFRRGHAHPLARTRRRGNHRPLPPHPRNRRAVLLAATSSNPRHDVEIVEAYEWELHRMTLPDGQYGVICYYYDSTKLREAEAALRESEERLEADLAALTRMHQLSKSLVETEKHEPLFQEVMDAAVAIVGADNGTLQLLEGESLRIVAHHGHTPAFLKFFASAESRASVCGEASHSGERVIVDDVETSPLFADTESLAVLREAGVRAVQSTPLLGRKGELLGILTTQWSVPYVPNEHDLWRLDLLARQAADFIDNAQAKAALRRLAQFPEQNPDPVLRVGPGGAVNYANTAARSWLDGMGVVEGQPLQGGVWGLIDRVGPERPVVEEELLDERGRTYLFTAVRPPGEVYVNLYARDITERKQAEQALRESEERLRLAQEAAGIGAFEWNLQTGVNTWTPKLEEIIRFAVQALLAGRSRHGRASSIPKIGPGPWSG